MTTYDAVKENEITMERDSLKEQVASLQRSAAMQADAMKDSQKLIEERDITILQLRLALSEAHGSLAMHQDQLYRPQLDNAVAMYREKYEPKPAGAIGPTDANKAKARPKSRKKAKG
jgi:uncharacterized protein HemX